jgi:hypothetical protein
VVLDQCLRGQFGTCKYCIKSFMPKWSAIGWPSRSNVKMAANWTAFFFPSRVSLATICSNTVSRPVARKNTSFFRLAQSKTVKNSPYFAILGILTCALRRLPCFHKVSSLGARSLSRPLIFVQTKQRTR